MCRRAGRRCETHWTPEQKAADNARRRAAYAARKSSHLSQSAFVSSQNDHYDESYKRRYAPETLSGHIDMNSLDEKSYLMYGFQDPQQTYSTYTGNEEDEYTQEQFEELEAQIRQTEQDSREESKDFTLAERTAMSIYTSWNHKKINYLYFSTPGAEKFTPEGEGQTSKFAREKWVEEEEDKNANTMSYDDYITSRRTAENDHDTHPNAFIKDQMNRLTTEAYTETAMREYTEVLDNAFSKASGEQRITYRGMKQLPRGVDFLDHVTKNYPLGAKKAISGVQSTSLSRHTALSFAGAQRKPGLVYEIRSASGINIADMSYMTAEQEVLLPRNSQYVIVGSHFVNTQYHQVAVIQMVEVDDNNNIRTRDNLRTHFGDVNYEAFRSEKEGS